MPLKTPLEELKANLLKHLGANFLKKMESDVLHFSFLNAEDGTIVVFNFPSHCTTFTLIIQSSNVPIKNIPFSKVGIHKLSLDKIKPSDAWISHPSRSQKI
jgi:hypothetical protein